MDKVKKNIKSLNKLKHNSHLFQYYAFRASRSTSNSIVNIFSLHKKLRGCSKFNKNHICLRLIFEILIIRSQGLGGI